jgi:hypothetical protein
MTLPSNTREDRLRVATQLAATYSLAELHAMACRSQGVLSVAEVSTRRLQEVVVDALMENYRQNPLSFEWDCRRLENLSID